MSEYMRKRKMPILAGSALIVFIHLYFGYLVSTKVYVQDLIYLDGILSVILAVSFFLDCRRFQFQQKRHKEMEAEIARLQEENGRLLREIDEQSDYIAKWSHEVKLPLSALGLMNERNPDKELKDSMEDCLARIRQQLSTMLMSGKLKTLENDVVLRRMPLAEAVGEAVKGQSWSLIREHFQIEMGLCDIWVYSDRRWLAYILGQLIANAVKYKKGENPCLCFGAERTAAEEVRLWVEDNGIGIEDADLPYIFDRGYIGGNLRNGDYRSTGMGLYFAKEAAERLGIELEADSQPGEWTRFTLYFRNNAEFFLMEEEKLPKEDMLQEC